MDPERRELIRSNENHNGQMGNDSAKWESIWQKKNRFGRTGLDSAFGQTGIDSAKLEPIGNFPRRNTVNSPVILVMLPVVTELLAKEAT